MKPLTCGKKHCVCVSVCQRERWHLVSAADKANWTSWQRQRREICVCVCVTAGACRAQLSMSGRFLLPMGRTQTHTRSTHTHTHSALLADTAF